MSNLMYWITKLKFQEEIEKATTLSELKKIILELLDYFPEAEDED